MKSSNCQLDSLMASVPAAAGGRQRVHRDAGARGVGCGHTPGRARSGERGTDRPIGATLVGRFQGTCFLDSAFERARLESWGRRGDCRRSRRRSRAGWLGCMRSTRGTGSIALSTTLRCGGGGGGGGSPCAALVLRGGGGLTAVCVCCVTCVCGTRYLVLSARAGVCHQLLRSVCAVCCALVCGVVALL